MTASAPLEGTPLSDPLGICETRLAERKEEVERLLVRERMLGRARLFVFLAGLVLLLINFQGDLYPPAWLLVPVAVFLLLVFLHDRAIQRRRRYERAVAFYGRSIDCIQDRWMESGEEGGAYCPTSHPYADDLDLFGAGSLYQRLCRAETNIGKKCLAEWLAHPAAPSTVRDRQAAVEELAGLLDFRESLAREVASSEDYADPQALEEWARAEPRTLHTFEQTGAVILAILNYLALAGVLLGRATIYPFLGTMILSGLYYLLLVKRVRAIEVASEHASDGLSTYAQLVHLFEHQPFESKALRDLQARLSSHRLPASQCIAQLAKLVKRLEEGKRNQLFIAFARLMFWSTQYTARIENWRVQHGEHIADWIGALAEGEALASLAAFRFENPDYAFPELVEGEKVFEGEQLGHPLLGRQRAVSNDFQLDETVSLVILSGSNMSGKSTFLRTLGTNIVLSLAGSCVRAKRLRLSPFRLGASIQIRDSLQEGISKFMREVNKIREVVEASDREGPFFFLIDEIFQGTNSRDRRIAAEAIVDRLVENGAFGLITTHDLALTRIVDRLGSRARNQHFEDQVVEGEMHFDYRLRPGVIQRGNALYLLHRIGLPVDASLEGDLPLD